eukprot:Plantae.Rhodophyta-Palmaria_palmata.ctg3199.p1 GENE.Plantae.Rhodophyta-Palmaria_palmata.ctg3199~~Plantae.Rhodophyta-Palmaria_palmata.ctg3199.p1  ORF type:complete len:215 (+),score=21.83 Plantae.Rhodophyta-Palmaria_palmata.ctg3199:128-772(+)
MPHNHSVCDAAWEEMWSEGLNPGDAFDASACHPALLQLISSKTLLPNPSSGRQCALVPGCGRGYEVCALAESGMFDEVIGLDLAPTGVAAAKKHAADVDGATAEKSTFVVGDFFDFQAPAGADIGLIVDHTFLCALPPDMREKWAQTMAKLLPRGGLLVTLIYPLLKLPEEGGPPYGVSFELFETLLCPVGFEACEPPKVLVCTKIACIGTATV